MTDAKLDRVIKRLGDLPSMPSTVAEAVEKMNDPDVDMADVAEIIQRDPALTAKLLKISNSPYYGMRQVVGTLKLAMVILGGREVKNILLGVSVIDTFDDEKTAELLKDGSFWNHCFRVGALSKMIAQHFKLNFQGEDFVAGLLHDIGKLVLYRQMTDSYAPMYAQSKGSDDELEAIENSTLGYDHADAAAALAQCWHLPETLRDAVRYHHIKEGESLNDAKDPKLAAVVRIANLASESIVEDIDENPEETDAVNDAEAWGALEGQAASTPEQRLAILNEFVVEVNKTPALKF